MAETVQIKYQISKVKMTRNVITFVLLGAGSEGAKRLKDLEILRCAQDDHGLKLLHCGHFDFCRP
jgi:hypothetical protein